MTFYKMFTLLFTVQIKVKRRGDDQKFLARVLAIGVECDMALLTGDRRGWRWHPLMLIFWAAAASDSLQVICSSAAVDHQAKAA
jgi:hypothetical protein